jgi:hypothetical protein
MKRKKELPDIPDKEVKNVKSILTQEDVNELFEYRDGGLYWKIDIYTGKNYKICNVKIGDKAGCVWQTKGNYYETIRYKRKLYFTSRLVFLMFNGYLPERVVFKDGNTLNTRIENLLEANFSQVQYRTKLNSKNKTGYKGVFFNKQLNKYLVYISKNLKWIYLGYADTAEEVNKFYLEAREKYHGDFLKRCEND